MNYEKIILDLYDRVVSLEEKVHTLENQLVTKEHFTHEQTAAAEESTKITRNTSRKYVMDKLTVENPAFLITKGNRAANADILLASKDNESANMLKAKFYHSKSFHNFPSGWHTVNKDDLANENLHLFIFNIEFEKSFHTFLYSRQELLSFVQDKTTDQNNLYHFYFHLKENKIIEVRDQEKDASIYYNNWTLPSKIM